VCPGTGLLKLKLPQKLRHFSDTRSVILVHNPVCVEYVSY
jgi:hypothetical protein